MRVIGLDGLRVAKVDLDEGDERQRRRKVRF